MSIESILKKEFPDKFKNSEKFTRGIYQLFKEIKFEEVNNAYKRFLTEEKNEFFLDDFNEDRIPKKLYSLMIPKLIKTGSLLSAVIADERYIKKNNVESLINLDTSIPYFKKMFIDEDYFSIKKLTKMAPCHAKVIFNEIRIQFYKEGKSELSNNANKYKNLANHS